MFAGYVWASCMCIDMLIPAISCIWDCYLQLPHTRSVTHPTYEENSYT